jgi:hypothetical protein
LTGNRNSMNRRQYHDAQGPFAQTSARSSGRPLEGAQ